jgi:hypothetical protein
MEKAASTLSCCTGSPKASITGPRAPMLAVPVRLLATKRGAGSVRQAWS